MVWSAGAWSRRAGLAAALGIGAGSVLLAALALAGLGAAMERASWLYSVLQVGGGAFLIHLALSVLSSAGTWQTGGATAARGHPFLHGLLTQATNPVTVAVYATVFSAILPPPLTGPRAALAVIVVLAIETG